METKHWFAVAAVIGLGAQVPACSSKFSSCLDTRTCAETGGTAGAAGDSAAAGHGGSLANEDAGASGASPGDSGSANAGGDETGASGSAGQRGGDAGAGGESVSPGSECAIGGERSCQGAKGNCANGKQTCLEGMWSACSITPKGQDACTPGDDANCNGSPNEGCDCKDGAEQSCGPTAVGICKQGKTTCSGGTWGNTCSGSVEPTTRDCGSPADNDCNGVPDNTKDSVCQCDPSSPTSCAGGAKCKSSGSAAHCVACLTHTDCNNGTCGSSNKCTCTPGYSGDHCEFLVFQGLGVGPGDSQSVVNNVSHDGTTVVGYSKSDDQLSQRHALRWVNGTLMSVPIPAGLPTTDSCEATAVDANGGIVGFCHDTPFQYANGTATAISLAPSYGWLYDVSKDGTVSIGVAAVPNNGGQQAFHRVNGTVSLVPKLDTDWSFAHGTSGDGSVIVGDEYIAGHVAWFWSAATGTKQLVEQPAGFENYYATDVSTDGKVIVGYSGGGYAIRWSGPSYAQYKITQNSAYAATNQDGTASVGTITTGTSTTSAAIWDANGSVHQVADYLTGANLSGWTLTEAKGISDDGKVVVGNGVYNGQNRGWIAHLP